MYLADTLSTAFLPETDQRQQEMETVKMMTHLAISRDARGRTERDT